MIDAQASDLNLASLCAAGDEAAIAQFEAECLPTARAAIARISSDPHFIDEVVQLLRTRLLCSKEVNTPPRIASYGGRGPLAGWVRTAAVRLALNLLRERRRDALVPADEELSTMAAMANAASDPELRFIRQHYREDFRSAFTAALATLSGRERTLLRLHLLDGLTEEQIGALYRAHRVTVARWLGRSRRQLFAATQKILSERLGLSHGELESLTGLVPSSLDLSLGRLLRSQ